MATAKSLVEHGADGAAVETLIAPAVSSPSVLPPLKYSWFAIRLSLDARHREFAAVLRREVVALQVQRIAAKRGAPRLESTTT